MWPCRLRAPFASYALILTLCVAPLVAGNALSQTTSAEIVNSPRIHAQSTSASASASASAIDLEVLMNWAERTYPQYFPGHQDSISAPPYIYRYYPATMNYVGVADGGVYVLGRITGNSTAPILVGRVSDFECLVYPARCKPARVPDGLLIDASVDLKDRASMESLLGGPLFAAWNPKSALGAGMKIMIFGTPDASCPSNTVGPLSTFSDAMLADIGYPGQASDVPSTMRFEATPAATCSAGSSGKHGPSRVFADGSQLWFVTSSLGKPEDLIKPFASTGQNGQGTNARIINTSVNYRLPYPDSYLKPWIKNGRARFSTVAQVTRLQVKDGVALNQVKQTMAVTFDNMSCRTKYPGRLCSMQWLFDIGIAQSDVVDWSRVPWAQHPNFFLDPAQANMPIVGAALIPPSGESGTHGPTGLQIFTSRGSATQHRAFDPTLFAVDIDFVQFKNAIRVASALVIGEDVGTDLACLQCIKVFGDAWNDPTTWVVDGLLSMQEIYDATGSSGMISGGYAWIYGGPAP